MITCLNVLFNEFVDSPGGHTCMHLLDSQGEHEFLWEGSRSLPLLMFLQCLLWRAVLSAGSHLTNQVTNKLGVRMDSHRHRNISVSLYDMPGRSLDLASTDMDHRTAASSTTYCAVYWHSHWMWLEGNMCLKSPLHPLPPVSFVSAASKQRDLGGVLLLSGS